MSLLDDFARVSKDRPCPVCSKTDWCLVLKDDPANPSRVICARIESSRRLGRAGWLHILRRDPNWRPNQMRRRTIRMRPADADSQWESLAAQYCAAVDPSHLHHFAAALGLSTESLHRLRIGWNDWAWSFPMQDAGSRVIGIHLRKPDGAKLSVKGSHLGLFVPIDPAASDTLFFSEGQTDTAALLDLGFDAVGRAGCRNSLSVAVSFAKMRRPRRIVVVADSDDVGEEGANELAAALAAWFSDVRVVRAPNGVKDVREWTQRGAKRADVEAAIEAVSPVRLQVRVIKPGVRS